MTSEKIRMREMTTQEVDSIADRHLGHPSQFYKFESLLFNQMDLISSDYDGGQWKFYVLSNGAWFMAPAAKSRFTLQDTYGQDYDISAEGAGLAAMTYLLNLLAWAFHESGMGKQRDSAVGHYHALLAYAYQGKDVEAIRAVLD